MTSHKKHIYLVICIPCRHNIPHMHIFYKIVCGTAGVPSKYCAGCLKHRDEKMLVFNLSIWL